MKYGVLLLLLLLLLYCFNLFDREGGSSLSAVKMNYALKTVVFYDELNLVNDVMKAGIIILLKRMYTSG